MKNNTAEQLGNGEDFQQEITVCKVLNLCKQVLENQELGLEDNFFDFGGNSRRVISLKLRVKEEFHKNLPAIAIYTSRTIQDLAIQIMHGEEATGYNTDGVNLLNSHGSRNVFSFPPLAGWGVYYSELANHLKNFSFYSIDFIEAKDRLKQYVRLITSYQEKGPYILLGYSIGGNIAFEVAKELERQGYLVSDLILLDVNTKRRWSFLSRKKEDTNVRKFLDVLIKLNDYLSWLENTVIRTNLSKTEIYQIAYNKVSSAQRYYAGMVNRGKIHADIHFLKTSFDDVDYKDCRKGWNKLTRGTYSEMKAYGGHLTMLEGNNIKENARLLQEILDAISKKQL